MNRTRNEYVYAINQRNFMKDVQGEI